ncbi:hypothetical protein C9I89_21825 [Photobacterium lipolyticum]|uniref:Uncharacterized protein n=1 Tax=Photobacterium lipolyticum TaxID=266810 RepID=A0A2T3MQW4_9GAMM|nr:hypothetical protein C9I89_21825 [Photobacterium lipolyticum]
MLIDKLCPVCNCRTNFLQLHRTFFEKHVVKKDWLKYQCSECKSEVFAHRFQAIGMKIGKRSHTATALFQ